MPLDLTNLPPFIRWYIEAAGEYTVPPHFHYWCALSLLAAFAGRRYWYGHLRGRPLYPNLYIGLIGDSSSFKGVAMDESSSLVHPGLVYTGKDIAADLPYLFSGRTTAEGLVTLLSERSKKLGEDHAIEFYFVSPELSHSLKMPRSMVSGFIHMMTDVYDNTSLPWSDMTRMYGFFHIKQTPCINWLFASNADWMHSAVSDIDLEGGFAGRILPIISEGQEPYVHAPRYPENQLEMQASLRFHLLRIRNGGGPFTMTDDALQSDMLWCKQRYEEQQSDKRMRPFVRRGGTLAKKLGMLFALARGVDERIIDELDIRQAQRAVMEVEKDLPRFLDLVFTNQANRAMEAMKEFVRGHQRVGWDVVARMLVRQFGVKKKDIMEYENTLVHMGLIEVDYKRKEYVWKQ